MKGEYEIEKSMLHFLSSFIIFTCVCFYTSLAACEEATTHFPSVCALLLHYDSDKDGFISDEELQNAQNDYRNEKITGNELLPIIQAWRSSGGIEEVCPGCTHECMECEEKGKKICAEDIGRIDDFSSLYTCVVDSSTGCLQWKKSSPQVIFGKYCENGEIKDIPVTCNSPTGHFSSGCEVLIHALEFGGIDPKNKISYRDVEKYCVQLYENGEFSKKETAFCLWKFFQGSRKYLWEICPNCGKENLPDFSVEASLQKIEKDKVRIKAKIENKGGDQTIDEGDKIEIKLYKTREGEKELVETITLSPSEIPAEKWFSQSFSCSEDVFPLVIEIEAQGITEETTSNNKVEVTQDECFEFVIGEKSSPCPPYGDLNGDGKLSYADAKQLEALVLNNGYEENGDLNADGVCDIEDFSLLIEYLLGEKTIFPVCEGEKNKKIDLKVIAEEDSVEIEKDSGNNWQVKARFEVVASFPHPPYSLKNVKIFVQKRCMNPTGNIVCSSVRMLLLGDISVSTSYETKQEVEIETKQAGGVDMECGCGNLPSSELEKKFFILRVNASLTSDPQVIDENEENNVAEIKVSCKKICELISQKEESCDPTKDPDFSFTDYQIEKINDETFRVRATINNTGGCKGISGTSYVLVIRTYKSNTNENIFELINIQKGQSFPLQVTLSNEYFNCSLPDDVFPLKIKITDILAKEEVKDSNPSNNELQISKEEACEKTCQDECSQDQITCSEDKTKVIKYECKDIDNDGCKELDRDNPVEVEDCSAQGKICQNGKCVEQGSESYTLKIEKGLNFVSLPVLPEDKIPGHIFGENVKVFEYSTQDGKWVEAEELKCGTGYYIDSSEEKTITLEGSPCEVSLNDLINIYNSLEEKECSFIGPGREDISIQGSILEGKIKDPTYIPVNTLHVSKAYWLCKPKEEEKKECDNDGECEEGENCANCPNDCGTYDQTCNYKTCENGKCVEKTVQICTAKGETCPQSTCEGDEDCTERGKETVVKIEETEFPASIEKDTQEKFTIKAKLHSSKDEELVKVGVCIKKVSGEDEGIVIPASTGEKINLTAERMWCYWKKVRESVIFGVKDYPISCSKEGEYALEVYAGYFDSEENNEFKITDKVTGISLECTPKVCRKPEIEVNSLVIDLVEGKISYDFEIKNANYISGSTESVPVKIFIGNNPLSRTVNLQDCQEEGNEQEKILKCSDTVEGVNFNDYCPDSENEVKEVKVYVDCGSNDCSEDTGNIEECGSEVNMLVTAFSCEEGAGGREIQAAVSLPAENTKKEPSRYIISLKKGWNMISLPSEKELALSTIKEKCKIYPEAYYFNVERYKWEIKKVVEPNKGMFIYSYEDCVSFLSLNREKKMKIKLEGGKWNLVGGNGITKVREIIEKCGTAYIYYWDPALNEGKGGWIKLHENDEALLEEGKSYWVYVKNDCEV